MTSNTTNPTPNVRTPSTELIEEYRRQSALVSLPDSTDIDFMDFLDKVLLYADQP
jgi:hypothetical protein